MPTRPLPGWTRLDDGPDGVPRWSRDGAAIHVATRDLDLLRYLDAALVRFDTMSRRRFTDLMTPDGRH